TLERMTLSPPRYLLQEWKERRPKRLPMSFAQAKAIVDEGLKRGTRRHRSLALGVAAQFELTLAEIDVIGSWEKIDRARAMPMGAIARAGRVWRPGLCFEHFVPNMILDMRRSKNSKPGVF